MWCFGYNKLNIKEPFQSCIQQNKIVQNISLSRNYLHAIIQCWQQIVSFFCYLSTFSITYAFKSCETLGFDVAFIFGVPLENKLYI
jgi:hypothetical protein